MSDQELLSKIYPEEDRINNQESKYSTFLKYAPLAALALGGALAVFGLYITFAANTDPKSGTEVVLDTQASANPGTAGVGGDVSGENFTEQIRVDVQGAVEFPGVVSVSQGSVLEDAIFAAGGFSDLADLEWVSKHLNQAAPVYDGDYIFINFLDKNRNPSLVKFIQSGRVMDDSLQGTSSTINNTSQTDYNTQYPSEGTSLPGPVYTNPDQVLDDIPNFSGSLPEDVSIERDSEIVLTSNPGLSTVSETIDPGSQYLGLNNEVIFGSTIIRSEPVNNPGSGERVSIRSEPDTGSSSDISSFEPVDPGRRKGDQGVVGIQSSTQPVSGNPGTQNQSSPTQNTTSSPDQGSFQSNQDNQSVSSQNRDEPQGIIKKSSSGICHSSDSPWYERTKNFTSFATVEECLASGGRLPKT
jgi:DNA uptake protein ComE-like DNA-binding protein